MSQGLKQNQSASAARTAPKAPRLASFRRVADVGLLSAGSLLAYPVGVASSALCARWLGPADFGELSFFMSVLAFTVVFFRFGFFSASGYVIGQERDEERRRSLIGATCLYTLAMGLMFATTIFALGFVVDQHFGTQINSVLRWSAPLVIVLPFEAVLAPLTRAVGAIRLLAFLKFAPKLLYLLLLIAAVKLDRMSLGSIVLMYFGSTIAACAVILLMLRPSFGHLRDDLGRIARATRAYGFPLYVGQLLDGSTAYLDRILLPYYFTTTDLGYFALANAFASVLVIIPQSLSAVIYRDFVDGDRIPRRVHVLTVVVPAATSVPLLLLCGPVLELVFGEAYRPAAAFVPLIALGAFFQGLYQPYATFFEAKGYGPAVRNNFLLQGATKAISTLALVPVFGPQGAAASLAITRFVHYLLHVQLMRRHLSSL